jgi:hypothetical protein
VGWRKGGVCRRGGASWRTGDGDIREVSPELVYVKRRDCKLETWDGRSPSGISSSRSVASESDCISSLSEDRTTSVSCSTFISCVSNDRSDSVPSSENSRMGQTMLDVDLLLGAP